MMNNEPDNAPVIFDVGIIGGGLAGLSLSILLSKAGYKIILFEKEKYPFHRVCGEYISFESWDFINHLGLNLAKLNLPVIKKLVVSSPNGAWVNAKLGLGGFGISRYLIDNELQKIAGENGVKVLDETKVNDVVFNKESFVIKYSGGEIMCPVVAGCFGKRSNLDVKWSRDFIKKKPGKLNNYIGIKYHIKTDEDVETISLHNFKNGYCGLSKIEGDAYCLCYLTTAQNLQENNNSIKEMEQNVLFKNPFLKNLFEKSEFIFREPVTISQISFDKKHSVENHVIMCGDASGMITPLCGNGMSMGMHAAKIAFNSIDRFLKSTISREQMENEYILHWEKLFSKRLNTGRRIQGLFGKEFLTNWFIRIIKPFPFIISKLIKATHGKEF